MFCVQGCAEDLEVDGYDSEYAVSAWEGGRVVIGWGCYLVGLTGRRGGPPNWLSA